MHTIRKYSPIPHKLYFIFYTLQTPTMKKIIITDLPSGLALHIGKDGKMIEKYLHWDNLAFRKQIGLGQ
jgi:hypothetical protein